MMRVKENTVLLKIFSLCKNLLRMPTAVGNVKLEEVGNRLPSVDTEANKRTFGGI